MERAIILAAGKGERLVNGLPFPKPLKRVGGVPLIVRVLRNLERTGVREVAVIVGHLSDVLMRGLSRYTFDLKLTYVHNDEFEKPNGTSLLKAREFVTGPTLLLMSDHLWAPELVAPVASFPLAADEAVLGIDFDVPRCFDLEDATKVLLEGDRVAAIGKQLPRYDALDTGVFKITPALMDALAQANGAEGCSLSTGVQTLAARGKMRTVPVGPAMWLDVDTREAHAFAERSVARYGEALQPTPLVAGL